jgi:RNA polymerase sigma factor (TIGR02999 family)
VTTLLQAWGDGDHQALGVLTPLVEAELRRIARRCMRGERRNHSLQATALVNEAYVRLVDVRRVQWRDRAHFLAMSARLMRRVLVDYARARAFHKRSGRMVQTTFVEGFGGTDERPRDVVALHDALTALADRDPRRAQIVELRFFGGLTVEETALALGISADTVSRDWKLAKAWLIRELNRGTRADAGPLA